MNEIKIGDFLINSSSKPFTIAEAGINHNGDLGTALKMIEAAKIAGVLLTYLRVIGGLFHFLSIFLSFP